MYLPVMTSRKNKSGGELNPGKEARGLRGEIYNLEPVLLLTSSLELLHP